MVACTFDRRNKREDLYLQGALGIKIQSNVLKNADPTTIPTVLNGDR